MTLDENHTLFWKTIRRCGFTEGFEWFATWLSTRRLRWPFGRQDKQPSPLVGWFATGMQIRANMQTAQMGDGSYILVENEEQQEAEQANIGKQATFPMLMTNLDIKQKLFYRSRNPRQAWDKYGNEVAL